MPAPPSTPIALALVGNPGAGKSTILNGIAKEPIFRAGISIATGLTTVLQHHHLSNGTLLFDTPGLSDIERKKQAGEELNKMLSKHLSIKIAFVVTLERGRVRPEDALTLNLLLGAISVDTNGKFGVIINQMSKGVIQKIKRNPDKEAIIRKTLTGQRSTLY